MRKPSDKVEEYINFKNPNWEYKAIGDVKIQADIKPLYERYDKSVIEEELKNLNAKK